MFASAERAEEYTCQPYKGDGTPTSLPRRSTTSQMMRRRREDEEKNIIITTTNLQQGVT